MEEKRGEILIYQTEDGRTKVDVLFDGETVWLTQEQISLLFQKTRANITMHISNIVKEGELDSSVCKEFLHTASDGKNYKVGFYNLNMILAVGYRVKSHRGIQFRKWASGILEEYMKKGFAMNDEVLKQAGGGNYFKELLERIRSIRSSEKVFYRQILDLFATSIDYDAKTEIATKFFKEMQNKLLYGIVEHTAAEIIAGRANAELPFMGLTSFAGSRPQKQEALTAKNYLNEDEIIDLNLMTNTYLDVAEMKARERKPMYMKDWVKELEGFLLYRKKKLLTGPGKVSHEKAVQIASEEYDKYKEKTKFELTQVEQDYLNTIRSTYELLEHKKPKAKNKY